MSEPFMVAFAENKLAALASKCVKSKGDTDVENAFRSFLKQYFGTGDQRAQLKSPNYKKLVGFCQLNLSAKYHIARAMIQTGSSLIVWEVVGKPNCYANAMQLYVHAQAAMAIGETEAALKYLNESIENDPEYLPAIRDLIDIEERIRGRASAALYDLLKSSMLSKNVTRDELESLLVYEPWMKLRRFGSEGDGGYLVMDQPGEYDIFISGGVNNNIDFELQICDEYRLKCIALDPTVDGLPVQDPRITLVKKAICGKIDEECTNLHEILSLHQNAFVKLDIEGSEYSWIESLSCDLIANIKQLVIEIHSPLSVRRLACISRLCEQMALVHVHPNNYQRLFTLGGVQIPVLFEATFVRKPNDRSMLAPRTTRYPHALDVPNIGTKPELLINHWPFLSLEK